MTKAKVLHMARTLAGDFCVAFVLFFLIEAASRGFVLKAALQQMRDLFPFGMALNLVVILSVIQIVRLFPFGRPFSRWAVFFVGLLLALANYLKNRFLGRPLSLFDFQLVQHFSLLVRYLGAWFPFLVILGSLGLGLLAWKKALRFSFPGPFRILGFVVGVGLITGIVHYREIGMMYAFAKVGIQTMIWDPPADIRNNGFLLSSLMNIRINVIHRPDEYSKANVKRVVGDAKMVSRNIAKNAPNVVLVLMESVWDPERLGVQITPHPLANLKSLANRAVKGTLVVPAFGGGTANTGFEILTGLSTAFIPPGSIAYQQFVNQRIGSLADSFDRAGYEVVALHNWDRTFWRRHEVFPLLGIDRFFGLQDLDVEWPKAGFPDDRVLYERTLERIRSSEKPIFSFLITVSTHGPYAHREGAADFTVDGPDITPDVMREITGFSAALRAFDRDLGDFIERLKDDEEETIVVLFGDHLPILGPYFGAYHQSGFVSSPEHKYWSMEETRKMYEAPLLLWSNKRDLRQKRSNKRQGEQWVTSANYLGLDVLESAGLEQDTPFLRYLARLRERFPLVHPEFVLDARKGIRSVRDARLTDDFRDYELLFYDRMFGEGWSGR